jgi:mannose PTS system EIID component
LTSSGIHGREARQLIINTRLYYEERGDVQMDRCGLTRIVLRSLLIQSSLNFSRMQNLGFAYSLVPFFRHFKGDKGRIPAMLTRHLQMFNTHPYFSGPVLGSVIKMEEMALLDRQSAALSATDLKGSLMGPYAALGDSFFWGALRPFSSLVGATLAALGSPITPLVVLCIYNPFHLWIRLRGFVEGYRKGLLGIEFIRSMDLLTVARRIRWISLMVLAILTAVIAAGTCREFGSLPEVVIKSIIPAFIFLCFWIIKKGTSPVKILYGMAVLFLIISV